jgi:tyrocidine synthetase-3
VRLPDERACRPASANQKRMFVLNMLSPEGIEYNVPVALRLRGPLDVPRLRAAVSGLAARHASLRTSFHLMDDAVVQVISRRVRVPVPCRDARSENDIEPIRRQFVRPFNLRRAPLFRACLVRLAETDHVLLLDAHHIICDGISVDILADELGRLYDGQALNPPAADYADFAIWQQQFARTPEARKQEEFWLRLLADEPPPLSLPTNHPRRAARSYAGDRVFARVAPALSAALRSLAGRQRVSMYMLFLAAYYVLLAKYTGEEDLVVGTLVSGRGDDRFQETVGLFVNTLALRSRPQGGLNFIDFLTQVRGDCLSAFENQDYQFEELVERISPRRDPGRNPLFDTMFGALAGDGRAALYRGLEFSRHALGYEIAKFDLSLTLIESSGDGVVVEFEYCKDLFDKSTIERFSADYLTVLGVVAASPHQRLRDISLLTAEEQRNLCPRPREERPWRSVVDLFVDRASENPLAPAVTFRDRTMSYGELHQQSNALAARLYMRGVRRGDLVGIVAAPSIDMLVGILGVLKIGAAYLPFDPATPTDRLRSIADDAGMAALLLEDQSRGLGRICPTTVVLNEGCGEAGNQLPAVPRPERGDLAYVIYTSGSTGTPKGVMVSHGALENYVTWAARTYIGGEMASFALHSSPSVDLTVTSIFAPLVSGSRIVVYQGADGFGTLRDIVRDNQVELIKLTPTHLTLLAEAAGELDGNASRLRRIIVGGEDLQASVAAKIHAAFAGRVEIFNEYGPTEATVGCTVHQYQPDAAETGSVPIGRPIDNTSAFVLDPYGNPVPPLVTGELFIAGACLADGYLNHPQLTGERFVVTRIGPAVLRTYRTGDLARMLPNGDLDYLGRSDHQVKIRGYRIELGEIETSLRRLPQVTEAAVLRRLDAVGDAYLCAYVVADASFSAEDAQARLAEHLPAYMIPGRFVRLERLPVGRSGKLDTSALPEPDDGAIATRPYKPARSNVEISLARIWEQVLGVGGIGVDDNFFDLGGQSLKAALMAARANAQLRADLSLRDVFAHPSIRGLAARVHEAQEGTAPPLIPTAERAHYPVSSAQKRLYILHQLAPLDVQYNVPFAIEVSGDFDAVRWEHAFRSLIARHESLRTCFTLIDDEIVQKVEPRVEFAFEDLACRMPVTLQEAVERFVRPFDLARSPLLRAAAIEIGPSSHALLVDMHHIVSDGISVEILLDELRALHRGERLEPPRIQYKDYATWHRAYLATESVRAQGAYWRKLFESEVPVLNLPTDFRRGSVQSFDGDLVRFGVEADLVGALRAVARDCGATLYMTLLAVYTVLLAKYAGQEDVVVGAPVAGRPRAELHDVVGMFVNTLPMRNQPRADLSFTEFLGQVRNHALDAYSNQDYQFEELVDALEIERDLSRNPLFDTVFALRSERPPAGAGAAALRLLDFDWKLSKFDLTLLAVEHPRTLEFEVEYCTKLFRRSTIERFATHYRHLLEQVVRHPARPIRDLDLLTDHERQQLLVTFNRTHHPYPADRSIHALIEERVERTPERVAVVFRDTSLTYGELNRRANQLARRLASHGLAREEVVGIVAEPSADMIVGVLAILKAGGAYLPIDADCPPHRARAMLDLSGARILLTAGAVGWRDESRLAIDLGDRSVYRGDASNPGTPVGGHDLAYVIYTSGTTGVPKGVMIEHHAVNNLCAWHNETFQVTADDRATKYARFGFDASVWEIFPYLQAGAALHVIDERIRLDLAELNRYFEAHGISISFLPTQICEAFMELQNHSLRVLLTGGDRLRRVRPQTYRLVNNYGPTECTVVATSCTVVGEEQEIPIGTPLFNTRIYILGSGGTLAPVGVPGEMCIAGVSLARGYIHDPARTAEKFVADPFEPGARMYRTGDLARWLADGAIQYLGRADDQVKIRGCRTEPREIEATILAHASVRDAVVVAREDGQHRTFLTAYVVWQGAPQAAALRAYLASRLPDYMVPSYVLTVERIPVNARGKVDLAQLPDADSSMAAARGHVEPRTDSERKLVDVWRRVLDRERIGVHDNFFEIGGDSLRATIMVARANREFGTDVALGAVFDNHSIAALARCFEGGAAGQSSPLPAVARRPHYAITPTQSLLHALCASRKGIEYNLPMAFSLEGELDATRMSDVFRRLIDRHEALRTSFHTIGNRVVQAIAPKVDFAMEVLPPCEAREFAEVARDFIRPFDLTTAPLLRAALLPMGPRRHVLLLDVHHLVSDGTSMGILFQEMASLYSGIEPPVRQATFKDFAEWLPAHLQTSRVRAQAAYWQGVLGEPPAPLKLDTDYPRPGTFSFAGGRIDFAAEPAVHRGLKRLCAEHEVTLYMVLLAAYNVLLSKYGGQEDIIVGVPTAGRYLADVQDVVGMFVSTHAIRTRPRASLRFDAFLQQVKAAVRGAVEHQEYQLWDMLVRHSIVSGGKPLFSTVFVVQDRAFTAMEMPGLDVEEMDPGYHVSKFDLTFGAVERAEVLEFELEYSTDVFRRGTAQRFARHYLNLLDQIVADTTRELRQLELVTGAERDQILFGRIGAGTGPIERGGTVIQRFEGQAHDTPERVAAVCDGRTMTFGELNGRANRVARRLRADGVETGDIVALAVSPSLDMLVAILAVLKAGGAYLPLGTADPANRVALAVAEGGARLILRDVEGLTGELDGTNLDIAIDASALAYVNCVADRSGVLRAVPIEHQSVVDRCRWYTERFAVTADDRSAKYGDLTTSSSIFEIFPFLCAGASVCIVPERVRVDGTLLPAWLEETGVTMAWLPAPMCAHLAAADNTTLRAVITSEEPVSGTRSGRYELVRCFGPAEDTEVTTACAVQGEGRSAIIGAPIPSSRLYILGHDDGVLPIGVSGELCVAGAGLARVDPGQGTAEPSRFAINPHVPDTRMYRTGYRGRWLPDGRVELTARIDEVSIDGHRVSLSEIERRLEADPGIKEAAVVFDDADPRRQRLVAFVTLRGSLPPSAESFVHVLRLRLGEWLPGYMIPAPYIKVGAMPRDGNGRIDYERLPVPESPSSPLPVSSPTIDAVRSLVGDLLQVPHVDSGANLVDLGLDSLRAAQLAARMGAAFGAAPVVCQILTTPTVAAISKSLEGTSSW